MARLSDLNWDAQFHKKNEFIENIRFSIRNEISVGNIQLKIVKNEEAFTAPIINRFLGTIHIYIAPKKKECDSDNTFEESILDAEIDCEVCSYISKGEIRYHLLWCEQDFYRLGYSISSSRKYSVEYID